MRILSDRLAACARLAPGVAAACWFLCSGVWPAQADLFYFKAGGQAQLPAQIEGDSVRLLTPDGPLDFRRSDFRKIVPGHWPEHDWPARRTEALRGGAAARYQAAWWALENGLTAQAEAMLRDAFQADPTHQPTGRLVALLNRLDRPCGEPDLSSIRAALQGRFEVSESPHVVLLHQHSAAEAQERLDVIERVVRTYYLVLCAQGFELTLPRERLVSVWFAERRDYLDYLHAEHADAFQSTTGYFHPTRNIVLAYDARSTDAQRAARSGLDARRRELAETRDRLPPRGRFKLSIGGKAEVVNHTEAIERLAALEREVRRQQLLLDLDRRTIDLGTAAHETVHELVACSGFAPRHADFPLWLQEGFAAQFEVIRGGRWAGFSRAHDARLPDWRKIQPPPRLARLVRDTDFGRGYHPGLYAEAWALVYHLRTNRPRDFVTFLDRLRAPDDALTIDPDRTMTAFRAAFGSDLASLEASWHRFLSEVRTPLESAE